ncbi:hypothetical protein OG196_04305 [Kitasatospora purpeofusca]|nr:hypothetical protein OG196_04305 [Kitasatospora purpeofusca]
MDRPGVGRPVERADGGFGGGPGTYGAGHVEELDWRDQKNDKILSQICG